MNNSIIIKLQDLKSELKSDGVSILGVFGSYARGDYTENSDVDILYQVDNPQEFAKKYQGFEVFSKLTEMKEKISKSLNKKVDFVDRDGLNEIGERFILKEIQYV
ncbi:MAG: nucleotidyltransferase domain-containing protein [Campylobacterales bacterium]|nr:nucleotidyltransferase domain-containing protein [Campylobacterales bacterium]